MEAIGRLAGGVAHDFNNLLTIILGYGESAIEMLPKDHPAWSSITEVLRAGERAAGLTQRLLAFSRKQVVQPEVLDLNAIVFGMEEMLRRLIGEDVQIAVNLDPTIGRIRADQNQVEQVVMNLAVNARDAMPDGGQLRISTYPLVLDSADAAHDPSAPQLYAVLSITDTGFGMDAETQAQIFEPFFTTKEKGKGTGLGLSTVYGIVQQSRGFITVRSEPGQGSTFSVHLPCTAEDQKPADTSEFDGQPAGSGRILLVEDEAAVRELTRRMLVDSGYAVIVSSDAGDALRLRKSELEGVDLLLTDVVMPGLSGPELAEHLVKRQPGLKVLYLSGYTDHPLIGQQVLSDRESFLQKPFTQAQLLKTVQRVMRRG
jgi:CheY-like chemotaxis protein